MAVPEAGEGPTELSDAEVGTALLQARTGARMSRAAVEAKSGVSASAIFRYEAGERTVPFDTLQALVLACGFESVAAFLDFAATLRVRLIPASA